MSDFARDKDLQRIAHRRGGIIIRDDTSKTTGDWHMAQFLTTATINDITISDIDNSSDLDSHAFSAGDELYGNITMIQLSSTAEMVLLYNI